MGIKAGAAIGNAKPFPDLETKTVIGNVVITEEPDKPAEMSTSFHRFKLNSQCWEFAIASHNGHEWIQHLMLRHLL